MYIKMESASLVNISLKYAQMYVLKQLSWIRHGYWREIELNFAKKTFHVIIFNLKCWAYVFIAVSIALRHSGLWFL